jgi:GTPase SAR1 family protein
MEIVTSPLPPDEGEDVLLRVLLRFQKELPWDARKDLTMWQWKYDPVMGVPGARAFAELLSTGRYTDMVGLSLHKLTGDTVLGNEGTELLVNAISRGYVPHLRELNLSGHNISSFKALAEAIESGHLRSLETFSVSWNPVSDREVERLVDSLRSVSAPRLRILDMRETAQFLDSEQLAALMKTGALDQVGELYVPSCWGSKGLVEMAEQFSEGRLEHLQVFDWSRGGPAPARDLEAVLEFLQRTSRGVYSSLLRFFEAMTTDAVHLARVKAILKRNQRTEEVLRGLSEEDQGDPQDGRIVFCGYGLVGKSTLRGVFDMANYINLWTNLERGPLERELSVREPSYLGGLSRSSTRAPRGSRAGRLLRTILCCKPPSEQSTWGSDGVSGLYDEGYPGRFGEQSLGRFGKLSPELGWEQPAFLGRLRQALQDVDGFARIEREVCDGESFEHGLRNLVLQIDGESAALDSLLSDLPATEEEKEKAFRAWVKIRKDALAPIERTIGAAVAYMEVRPPGLRLSLWDMAGQPEFHIFHSIFLPDACSNEVVSGKACTFLLVVKGTRSTTVDEVEKDLKYWLRFIAANTATASKRRVLLVLNWHEDEEEGTKRLWKSQLRRLSDTFKAKLEIEPNITSLDAATGRGVRALFQEVQKEARKVLAKASGTVPLSAWPSWTSCPNWLQLQKQRPSSTGRHLGDSSMRRGG